MAVALEQAEHKAQADVAVSGGAATNAPVAGVGSEQKAPSQSVWVEQPVPRQDTRVYYYSDGTTLTKKGGTVAWRNNNEGNLRPGKLSSTRIGQDRMPFAIFATPEEGRRAKTYLLFSSDSYKDLSLEQAIAKYAPASDNNDPVAYAANVRSRGNVESKKMGQYKSDEQIRILDAMKKQEGYSVGTETRGTHNLNAPSNAASVTPTPSASSAAASEASDLDIDAIKSWYKEKSYTRDCVRAIQRAVGFTSTADVDGWIGPNTIRKVAEWQPTKGLTADGKFGTKSAEKAGISLVTTSGKTLYSPQKPATTSPESVPDQKEVVKPADNKPAEVADNKPAAGASGGAAPAGGVSAPANVDTTSLETGAIKAWYAVQGYTQDTIKAIQRAVGFTASADIDGAVGGNTAKKVMSWQESNGFTPNGRFDDACAQKAGITLSKHSTTEFTESGTNAEKKRSLLGFTPSATWSSADKAKIDKQMTWISVRIHDDKGQDNAKSLEIHEKLAANVRAIFEDIYTNAPHFKVCSTGGYCYRKVNNGSGSNKLSNHSWGAAFDINAGIDAKYMDSSKSVVTTNANSVNSKLNPFWKGGKPLETGDTEYAMRTRNHPVVKACAAHGFGWGGEYGDYMHFSYFGGS